MVWQSLIAITSRSDSTTTISQPDHLCFPQYCLLVFDRTRWNYLILIAMGMVTSSWEVILPLYAFTMEMEPVASRQMSLSAFKYSRIPQKLPWYHSIQE